MSSGERPIGAAKGKQSDTEALCQPPPPRPRNAHTVGEPSHITKVFQWPVFVARPYQYQHAMPVACTTPRWRRLRPRPWPPFIVAAGYDAFGRPVNFTTLVSLETYSARNKLLLEQLRGAEQLKDQYSSKAVSREEARRQLEVCGSPVRACTSARMRGRTRTCGRVRS